jgi:hypothetical protein
MSKWLRMVDKIEAVVGLLAQSSKKSSPLPISDHHQLLDSDHDFELLEPSFEATLKTFQVADTLELGLKGKVHGAEDYYPVLIELRPGLP